MLLDITDNMWKDHLLSMDHLKDGIGMRGYAQKNPLIEYKKEAFYLFSDLMNRIATESVKAIFHITLVNEPPKELRRRPQEMEEIHGELARPEARKARKQTPVRKRIDIGRNQPCHCGSGKKYKNCHMKQDQQTAS